MRLLVLACVLDHDAEAGVADGLFGAAENPDAGMIHFDFSIDALAGAEEEESTSLRGGHGIAVHRDDPQLMAGQGDAAIFDGAGVEKMDQQLLALRGRGWARRRRELCR